MSLAIIDTIVSAFDAAIEATRTPAPITPPLIIQVAETRPGLSPTIIAEKIIARQSEAGAPVGASSDGSANIAEKMERIRVEEILDALNLDARVDVFVYPGIAFTGTATGPGGQYAVVGTTLTPGHGVGIIV